MFDEYEYWWDCEIEDSVTEMQYEWKEITARTVAMYFLAGYNQVNVPPSKDLLEACDNYLKRYTDPFDGLGDVASDLKILTETGKSALLKAVTTKSKLYKAHAAELDAYVKAHFGDKPSPLRKS
jgi:hypothetical protein